MTNIIVVFPKPQDADSIRKLLIRNGYEVAAVCTSGTAALKAADRMDEGILVCGYRFADMMYDQLFGLLPRGFEMLLLASSKVVEEGIEEGVSALAMPLKTQLLIDTLDQISLRRHGRRKSAGKPKRHSLEQENVIRRAKECLMQHNHMTEEEAHRYLQKTSMENGSNLVDTAHMVLSLMS